MVELWMRKDGWWSMVEQSSDPATDLVGSSMLPMPSLKTAGGVYLAIYPEERKDSSIM